MARWHHTRDGHGVPLVNVPTKVVPPPKHTKKTMTLEEFRKSRAELFPNVPDTRAPAARRGDN